MKKLLTLILLTASLITINLIDTFAITYNYEFTITDNKRWNLETGLLQHDLRYTITNRIKIIPTNDNTIDAFADTYHHVLFYNAKMEYLGYKNTQYSTYEIPGKYLGKITPANEPSYPGFTHPTDAAFFSFMLYKSGNRIPIEALNNQTLLQVFGSYSSANLGDKENPDLNGYTLNEFGNTEMQGKNLIDPTMELGEINDNTGQNASSSNRIRLIDYFPVLSNTNYVLSTINLTNFITIHFYDINQNFITFDGIGGSLFNDFTTPNNAAFIRFKIGTTNINEKIQIEYGSTATPYEPYYEYLQIDNFGDFSTLQVQENNGRLRYIENQGSVANNDQPLLELNGLTLNELFDADLWQNNDFSNGTNNWYVSGGTFSVVNGYLEFIQSNIASSTFVGQGANLNAGSNYYVVGQFQPLYTYYNADSLLRFYNGDAFIVGDILENNVWQNASVYWTQINDKVSFQTRLRFTTGAGPGDIMNMDNVYLFDLNALGLQNVSKKQLDQYYEIYQYFKDGGTSPQTFTYDEPIYYDITWRLDTYFNGLDLNLTEFNYWLDGYQRLEIGNLVNDIDLYYAKEYAKDNNTSLSFTDETWENYYLDYLTFINSNLRYITQLNYLNLSGLFLDNNLQSLSAFNECQNCVINSTNEYYEIIGNNTNSFYFIDTNFTYPESTLYFYTELSSDDNIEVNFDLRFGNALRRFSLFNLDDYVITSLSGLTSGTASNFYMRYASVGVVSFRVYDLIVIDVIDLGLQNLTKQQLDNYLNTYLENIQIQENTYVLSFFQTSLNNIVPQANYVEPEPDGFLDTNAEGFLDNILTNIGFNNSLGKTTLSITILLFTAIALISIKASTTIIISVEILTFVGLTFLGWLPAWINIMIALGLILLLFLRFKGNGGSSNETSD